MRLAAALLGVLLATPAWAGDCPLDLGRGTGWVVFSDDYLMAFRADPLHIEVGEPFALLINVCTRRGGAAELLAVDANMPAHRHGMNYRATIVAKGDGRFRAEGLLFHMPGRWEINFDVRAGDESERLTHDIILK
ncbi:hypothetical protein [Reyranella sp.]|uniref:hypothetical protein n=1 Tax=Reyranella sp. TaxID=1929291 RepID=UPI000BD2FEF0|nr:hypothetical protein [Reyranella sp.]OYY46098.1 MAG: hypothetical protein B7Y57_04390 [Rhodospirillales bacterium 35-66-84]OYZ96478.1 MAG: hypothetical protein B7Y08_04750 [Rhodospirillales bacterium 24-66-33]OZB28359.1 MAG: hypothetical protein B7X63_00395 [Rhodospirillales bacterium 39-66-50]HQS14436.1 hypothetical protein [Reyranella sp.]HQT11433.1 hypothetical protein [Reyranella sp.]